MENQREYFRTGKTAELAHRKAQLKRLRKAVVDNSDLLCEAVEKDLKRSAKLNYPLELASVLIEIDYMLDNLEAKPEKLSESESRTEMTNLDMDGTHLGRKNPDNPAGYPADCSGTEGFLSCRFIEIFKKSLIFSREWYLSSVHGTIRSTRF